MVTLISSPERNLEVRELRTTYRSPGGEKGQQNHGAVIVGETIGPAVDARQGKIWGGVANLQTGRTVGSGSEVNGGLVGVV